MTQIHSQAVKCPSSAQYYLQGHADTRSSLTRSPLFNINVFSV